MNPKSRRCHHDEHGPLPEKALARLLDRAKERRGTLDHYTHTSAYEEEAALAHVALTLADAVPDVTLTTELNRILAAEDPDVTVRRLARLVYAYGLRLRVSFEKIPIS
ncbi:MAG: hypothetical protein PHI12_11895 [Dehalococcoidales bacterium]|nr:hypothetical protein [Dehalococcoidales bacterium]